MQRRPDGRLDICSWQAAGYFVCCLPACTMPGHNDSWPNSGQFRDSRRNYRLEEASGEMQSSNQCMYFVFTPEALRVLQHIYCSCMAATCEHDQPLVPHMSDHGPVVPHPCIQVPSLLIAY